LGCVYASCLAKLGYNVVGADEDSKIIEDLKIGKPPIYEPGLDDLIGAELAKGNLTFTDEIEEGVKGTSYVVIAYDTPVDVDDNVDLSIIFHAARKLKKSKLHATIIVSSQVPVGTCQQLVSLLETDNVGVDLAYVPENLRLGQAIDRFLTPEMLVIGADTPSAMSSTRAIFKPIRTKIIEMDLRSAEMTKHVLNAYLATSISFANEIGNICDLVGADALKVTEALKSDGRIGERALLRPGMGFAGGTLARDLVVLKEIAKKNQYEPTLVNAVLEVNRNQTTSVVNRVGKLIGSLRGKTFCILGLTYKPGTDTLRRSAALEIVKRLQQDGASVRAFDPRITASSGVPENLLICDNAYAACEKAEIVVVLNNSPEFANLDFDRIKTLMKKPIIFDTQNMLDPTQMKSHGFGYAGIGRGTRTIR
jgi:UDPglucose 6-dehydrogenase